MAGPDHQDESLGALFGRLVEDGKGYARAEIAYYKTLARAKLGEARTGLLLGAVALVLLVAAAIALVVGSLLALATLVGPGYATLITVAVTLVVAGLLGWFAAKHLQRAFGGGA
jgi:hypothetical protein